jgi:hypothetical protein
MNCSGIASLICNDKCMLQVGRVFSFCFGTTQTLWECKKAELPLCWSPCLWPMCPQKSGNRSAPECTSNFSSRLGHRCIRGWVLSRRKAPCGSSKWCFLYLVFWFVSCTLFVLDQGWLKWCNIVWWILSLERGMLLFSRYHDLMSLYKSISVKDLFKIACFCCVVMTPHNITNILLALCSLR